MILYNVTVSVEDSVKEDWLEWMKKTHIPDVLASNLFVDYKMLRLLGNEQSPDTQTFAVQYFCESMANFELYEQKFAPKLRQEVAKRYGNKCLSFRTLLEVL